ncbi:MAG: hypothetical protein HY553_10700, partial [Elusimicrobia bacterium]|nr:hypothetical protein [Elusimicrobiota bacterium]
AQAYHKHLTGRDIIPDAPRVESMVDDWEYAVTNHWLAHQPPAKQQQVRDDVSYGNTMLKLFRGKVEDAIREKRRAAAADAGEYLASAPAQAAAVWKEPAPAIEVARGAERDGQQARGSRTSDEAARRADQVFSQRPPATGPGVEAPAEVEAAPEGTGPSAPPASKPGVPTLTAPLPGAPPGGFKVEPPPSPVIDRDKPVEERNPYAVLAKKALPTVGGGILGALLGFFLGGPVGALVGAAVGAAAGWGVGKLLS